MKAKKLFVAFVALVAMITALPTETVAARPHWANSNRYGANVRQVYFPEQNMYYDLHRDVYIFLNGRNWAVSASLPRIFANINFGIAPQVRLEINSDYPYRYYSRDNYYRDKHYYKNREKADREYSREIRKAEKHAYKHNRDNDYYRGNEGHGNGNGHGHGNR